MKQIKHQPYPDTARGEVVDDYFGTAVADPYRWLEDDNSEATAAGVAAENADDGRLSGADSVSGAIRERSPSCGTIPSRASPPSMAMRGTGFHNNGLQNQSCSSRPRDRAETQGHIYLDPNACRRRSVGFSDVSISEAANIVLAFYAVADFGVRLGPDPVSTCLRAS